MVFWKLLMFGIQWNTSIEELGIYFDLHNLAWIPEILSKLLIFFESVITFLISALDGDISTGLLQIKNWYAVTLSALKGNPNSGLSQIHSCAVQHQWSNKNGVPSPEVFLWGWVRPRPSCIQSGTMGFCLVLGRVFIDEPHPGSYTMPMATNTIKTVSKPKPTGPQDQKSTQVGPRPTLLRWAASICSRLIVQGNFN